jgi:lipoprotein-anchoring transpeptidase ErfK/SrfK
MSSGCIRMINEDIIDLFDGTEPGAIVVVLTAGRSE